MLFHYFFTLYLSLVYTVNHFYVFPVLQKSLTKRSRSNVKFSLYLKKAGLASRNIVRTKKPFYVVPVSASIFFIDSEPIRARGIIIKYLPPSIERRTKL